MPDLNRTHKPFWGSSKRAQGLFSTAGSGSLQHVLGPLLSRYSDVAIPLQKKGWGCHTAVQGFHLFLQNWIAVLMVPLHSNASEPQESLGCQGKQKSSLQTHNFLKIVSSNLATGHLSVLSFVFYSVLCFILLGSSHPAELSCVSEVFSSKLLTAPRCCKRYNNM